MNIQGKRGQRTFDADLLVRLRTELGGGSITKAEAQKVIADTVKEMKSEFRYERSTRGLSRMEDAVRNTLEDAVSWGWVKTAGAKSEIEKFLTGGADQHGSLEHTTHFIKDMVAHYRETNPVSLPSARYGT